MSVAIETDLEGIANALDDFPQLTENQRAELFHAYETAPRTLPPDPSAFLVAAITGDTEAREREAAAHEWYDAYYKSPAARAWQRVRGYWMTPVDPERPYLYHMTLDEASGYESCPTQGEILTALNRAAEYNRENR